MIRPVYFGYIIETAVNNAFQVAGNDEDAQQKALNEFDQFVSVLRNNGVNVTVAQIRKANGLTEKSILKPGQKLFIPKPGT